MTCTIHLSYTTSTLDGPYAVVERIREDISPMVPGDWDTTNNRPTFYKDYVMDAQGRFPTGLARVVFKYLKEDGQDARVVDERVRPGIPFDMTQVSLVGIEPFQFQLDAIKAAMTRGNAIIKATTAAGKSVILFGCIQTKPDINWLVLSASKKIVAQLAENFERMTLEKPGVFLGGKQRNFKRVTFATFSQLYGKLADPKMQAVLAKVNGVIIDEVHEAAAATRKAVVDAIPKAYWRIGLSATPFKRGDNRHEVTIGLTGPQVYEIKAEELVALGRISKLRVNMVAYSHTARIRVPGVHHGPEFLYRKGIVENKARNALVMRVIRVLPKPALVFSDRIKHGKALEDLVRREGFDTKFVSGDTPESSSQEYIKRLNSGLLDVIFTNKVMNAGVDIPNLRAVLSVSAGKAAVQVIQRMGRPMRKADGKEVCEYWDIADQGEFERHTSSRIKEINEEGWDINWVYPQDLERLEALLDG